jgi:hypothetical protein
MLGSRIGKLFLGAVTLLPLAYMAYSFWLVLSSFGSGGPVHDEQQFNHLFKLHMATMALLFGLLVFYVIHLFRTSAVPNDKKALWAVVLFFGNIPAMIVYWFLYIWRAQPHTTSE